MDQALTNSIQLRRIADALERLSPLRSPMADLTTHQAYVWHGRTGAMVAVDRFSYVPLKLLQGVEEQAQALLANTRQFARGFPANNALLWGARGMGKSSLVKAVVMQVAAESKAQGLQDDMVLVELHPDELSSLPVLLRMLSENNRRFVVFCDDLSFTEAGHGFRALKSMLDGGLQSRPDNVILYATSNRRHLIGREAVENEQADALMPQEVVEEKLSLSDRFGLWIGFHACSQDEYLAIVGHYAAAFGLEGEKSAIAA